MKRYIQVGLLSFFIGLIYSGVELKAENLLGSSYEYETVDESIKDNTAIVSLTGKSIKLRKEVDSKDYVGVVKTHVSRLEEQGEDLVMQLEIEVEREALNRRQSWRIIPELCSPSGETLTFAGVLLQGSIKEKLYKRKIQFENEYLLSDLPSEKLEVSISSDTLLIYTVLLPYELWMDEATLLIHQVLGSPANKEQLFTVVGANSVKLQPREPYQVEAKPNFISIDKEIKDWNMQGLARLDFPVGQSILRPDFRRNPEELSKIDAIVTTILEDTDLTLKGMHLEGFASPEGSYESNDRLSKARAEALKNYLKNKFSISENLFTVTNTPEDWDGLKSMVERSDILDKDRILHIIETVGIFDGRERQLMALSAGAPYRKMLTEMFPELRRVEYRADFNVREYNLEEAKEVIRRKPQNLSLYEILQVADSYRKEANDKELDYVYEIMLRQYPDHPAALINYAGYLLSQNESNGAKRYLDRVSDHQESYNNLGVFYLTVGDLDMAESYFTRALQNGIIEAKHNIEETNKKKEDNILQQRYKEKN